MTVISKKGSQGGKMGSNSGKSIKLGTVISVIIGLIVSGYVYFTVPAQLIIDIFREPLSREALIESGFSDKNIGKVASDEITVLESTEQILEIEQKKLDNFDIEDAFTDEDDEEEVVINDEESFMLANDFYVPEVKNIIPLNYYQISSDADTRYQYNSYKQRDKKPKARYIKTDSEGFLREMNTWEYDRYYMLELIDGGYLICLMDQDYYDGVLSTENVKFPVGKLDYQLNNTMMEFIEEYGAVEYCLVMADSEDEASEETKLFLTAGISFIASIVTVIILEVLQGLFNKVILKRK